MPPNPAMAARTTLVTEGPSKALLRCTLQAMGGALHRLRPPQPLIREVELPPLSGSNIPRSERPHVPWHLCPTDGGNDGGADAFQCTVADWFEPFSRPD